MICAIRINVPLDDVLAGMPNYGKFLKELISNKHKIKQISTAFLSDESSAMIQNKVPQKLGDPESFLIRCNFNRTFSCNALADLGASINLMPYSLYSKLSLKTLKPTQMSVRLADRSFQYPVEIAKNMLVEVRNITFPADFVILKMKEDSKKQLNLGVRTERMIFNIDSAMKHSYSNADICFSIDVIDEILEEDFDAFLDEGCKIFHFIEGTLLEEEIFVEFNEFLAMTVDENSGSKSNTKEPTFETITINTNYKIKTSLEEPHTDLKLKPLPDNLEYVFLEEPSFLAVIISSQLSKKKEKQTCSLEYISRLDTSKSNNYALKNTSFKEDHQSSPKCHNEDLGKLKPKADIGIFIGYAPTKKAYRIYNRWTRQIMETIHNPPPPTPYVSPILIAVAPRHANPTDTPLSSFVKQDAPIASTSSTTQETQSSIISEGVEGQLQQASFNDDSFFDILASKPSSQESSSIVQPNNPPFDHISKWTKYHPLDNVIGNPS
uniref:Reverse transcriptase domain-containing protein n=1 Tax=Tanacetum cinerariifolium TaxID=118510 RepID=A0A6L2NVY0_TANCI|nr:reverse transcriptase domain-containing protein [Tanacetum cinerariifolium]